MKKTNKVFQFGPRDSETFFVLNGDVTDDGKRLVTGYMDSGEPNNQGFLLDYATTKPYLLRYVEAFEKRTGGDSKGAVREMHQPIVVGKIVNIETDDQNGRIKVTVRIDDDDAWAKVLAKNYTGFSGHWTVVGQMWEDKAASAKYGRRIMRYTGDPVEVSLVDVPRVQGCEFQSIENGDTEGDDMKELLARVTQLTQQIGSVQNGISVGNEMASMFENMAYIHRYIEQEEKREGQDGSKADAIKAGLLALKPALVAYIADQFDELIDEDPDYETALAELQEEFPEEAYNGITEADLNAIMNGDFPGHPFRGNQHVSGKGKVSRSRKAHAATLHANEKGTRSAHARASAAHAKAAEYHGKRGNAKAAAFHAKASKAHGGIASKMNGDGVEQKNGATAPAPSAVNNGTNTNGSEETMKPEDLEAIINGVGAKVDEKIAAAVKPIQDELATLKAAQPAPVANGSVIPVPQMGRVVTHDQPANPAQPAPVAISNGSIQAIVSAIPESERTPINIAAALERAGVMEA